jgi:hypothetical protein
MVLISVSIGKFIIGISFPVSILVHGLSFQKCFLIHARLMLKLSEYTTDIVDRYRHLIVVDIYLYYIELYRIRIMASVKLLLLSVIICTVIISDVVYNHVHLYRFSCVMVQYVDRTQYKLWSSMSSHSHTKIALIIVSDYCVIISGT